MEKSDATRLAAVLTQAVDQAVPEVPLPDRDALLRSLGRVIDEWTADESVDLHARVHAVVDEWVAGEPSKTRHANVDERLVAEIEEYLGGWHA